MNILHNETMEQKIDKGNCLLAMPAIGDKYHRSSLVLITDVSDNMVQGVVVNRATDQYLSRLVDQMSIKPLQGFCDQRIMVGGPLHRDRLYLIYQKETTGVGPQTICSGELEDLQFITRSERPIPYIACIGSCEWTLSSLQQQVKNNDWLVLPCNTGLLINADHAERVSLALSRLGISMEQLSSVSGSA